MVWIVALVLIGAVFVLPSFLAPQQTGALVQQVPVPVPVTKEVPIYLCSDGETVVEDLSQCPQPTAIISASPEQCDLLRSAPVIGDSLATAAGCPALLPEETAPEPTGPTCDALNVFTWGSCIGELQESTACAIDANAAFNVFGYTCGAFNESGQEATTSSSTGLITGAFDFISTTVDNTWDGIATTTNDIYSFVTSPVDPVVDTFNSLTTTVSTTTNDYLDILSDLYLETTFEATNTINSTLLDAATTVTDTYDGVATSITTTFDSAAQTVNSTVDSVAGVVNDTYDGVQQTVEDGWNWLTGWI